MQDLQDVWKIKSKILKDLYVSCKMVFTGEDVHNLSDQSTVACILCIIIIVNLLQMNSVKIIGRFVTVTEFSLIL